MRHAADLLTMSERAAATAVQALRGERIETLVARVGRIRGGFGPLGDVSGPAKLPPGGRARVARLGSLPRRRTLRNESPLAPHRGVAAIVALDGNDDIRSIK